MVLCAIGFALIVSSAFSPTWRITRAVLERWVRFTAPLSTDIWADSWGIDRRTMRDRVVRWGRWFYLAAGLLFVASGVSLLLAEGT